MAASTLDTIAQTVTGLGYDLVDIERTKGGLLRVTIDLPYVAGTEQFINAEDCEKVTRQLVFVLEVEGATYSRLEVSSPGIDRPLSREKDFANWLGHEVRVQLATPVEGNRKSLQGDLTGFEGGIITLIDKKSGAVSFPFAEVQSAKLVLTDKLIAATRPLDSSGVDEILEEQED